jgi:predicted nucleotidyltransferase
LCYADIFDYPLSLAEIEKYLISSSRVGGVKINSALAKLVKTGQIKTYNKTYKMLQNDIVWYCLAGREENCQKRISRSKFSRHKLNKTRILLFILRHIPGVEAILLTGSLAMNNAKKDDDIDILVITKPGWLWRSRLIISLILEIFGKRRKPEYAHSSDKAKDKICANMYLSSNDLKMKSSQRNLYIAHEVIQALPLFDLTGVYSQFINENSWVQHYLPFFEYANNLHKATKKQKFKQTSLNLIEQFCYKLQQLYMARKITTEIIDQDRALFHPRDTATYVLNQYHNRLTKYLK